MSTVNKEKTSSPEKAAMKGESCSNTHDGEVVSFAGTKLVTKCSKGDEHNYTLAKDAKLTCDGTTCKSESLTVGKKVRVTTHKDDETIATNVESLNKQKEFAHCS